MKRRGRGRPRKNDPSDNMVDVRGTDQNELPEFFKIYKHATCSETLIIPPQFIKKFGGDIPAICTLTIPSGVSWQVDLSRTNDGWCFQRGWQEFVEENSLEDDEFMTFSLAGNSTFYVKIFAINACAKKTEDIEKPIENLEEKEVSQPVYAESSQNGATKSIGRNPSFTLTMLKSYFHQGCLPIPMEFWRSHMRKDRKDLAMVTLWVKDNLWILGLKTIDGRIRFTKGCSKFMRENSLEVGTSCTFELIDGDDLAFEVSIHRSPLF